VTDTVAHGLADVDGDGTFEPDALSEKLFELVPEKVDELDTVDEIDDTVEGVPETDCEKETVLQGDGVKETDTVPHELATADGDDTVEPDGLSVPLLLLVGKRLSVVDTVGEVESTVEIVGDVDGVLVTDGDKDCDPHGDAEKVADTVPHALGEVDGADVVETDGLTDLLVRPVNDAEVDAETTGEVDTVEQIDGEGESVPDPDCDMDRVPQADAEKVTDTVPQGLADADGDDIGEPDALSDQLFVLVPHDVYELDSVVEIVGDVECVPDLDGAGEPVLQGDGVWDTDPVPHMLDDADGDDIAEPDGLTVPLLRPVIEAVEDVDTVGEGDVAIVTDGDLVSDPDPDCVKESVPHCDAV
jgi:hypothetical protein